MNLVIIILLAIAIILNLIVAVLVNKMRKSIIELSDNIPNIIDQLKIIDNNQRIGSSQITLYNETTQDSIAFMVKLLRSIERLSEKINKKQKLI